MIIVLVVYFLLLFLFGLRKQNFQPVDVVVHWVESTTITARFHDTNGDHNKK